MSEVEQKLSDLINLGFTENVEEELLWFDSKGNIIERIKTPNLNMGDDPEEDNKF